MVEVEDWSAEPWSGAGLYGRLFLDGAWQMAAARNLLEERERHKESFLGFCSWGTDVGSVA